MVGTAGARRGEGRPGRPRAHAEPTCRHLGQVLESRVEILPAGRVGVDQQEGQGLDDTVLQKALSGEEKSDLDTTKA